MTETRTRLLILLALGVVGVASLLLAPLETLLPPEAKGVPRVALIIQPMILTLGAVFLGAWAAPKLGLDAPLVSALAARQPIAPVIRPMLVPALIAGFAVAAILLLYGNWSSDVFKASSNSKLSAIANFQVPLLSKLFYGGVAEELIARWGVMSAAALGALKLGMSRGKAIWVGNLIAAFLFAIGHVPLLMTLMPDPPAILLIAVLVGNMIPGLIFGWLFARRGLEAAMGAHAIGHLMSTLLS